MKATTKKLDNKKPPLCCRMRVMTIIGEKEKRKKERRIRDIAEEKIQTKQGEVLDVR